MKIPNHIKLFSIVLFLYGTLSYGQNNLESAPSLWGSKNQISSISFDYSGTTIGKNRNFYNSLSKPTQTQSWDILTDKVWASASLYDNQGRPALNTLSAPIGHNFGYSSSFILNDANSSYTTADFDSSSTTINNPDQVGSNSHLKQYYSVNNTDNPYQDITNYPFSRMVFSKLNPGSTLKVLGGNKINGDWKQSYSFTMSAGTELSFLGAYGSGYNTNTRVTKQVSRDVNGVDVVVFSDSDGNTLAAARSGNEEGSPATHSTTIQIGKQGYIDIHIPKGISTFSITNPDITTSGDLKVYDLITETELSPITTASTTRSVPSGFYRIAVSNTLEYPNSPSGAITVTHQVNYYDYSLNYFDKAGRLVSSKQPLNHLESTFSYNTLGQLLHTTSPDEGMAKFLYRKDGQIRFSQNSKQLVNGDVSYTSYDNLGRPIESGAFTHSYNFETLANSVDNSTLPTSITNLKDNHFTVYDSPDPGLEIELKNCGLPTKYYRQTFVAGNVSKTYTKNPETTITWYSYDVFGRVTWMIQKIPGLGCLKTIDYVYNPANGQVLEVDYQRHNKYERFVHSYKYNPAGQLEAVYTSTDGDLQTLQAQYKYNESGALVRTEIAENVQGIDYVYNINGQLKAINHPSLDSAKDPGHDGENGFMADVFGLAIDYYNGDYTRPATPTPVAQQTNTGTNQFNGNIKALHSNTQGFGHQGEFNSYLYDYNKNNWLESANFGSGTLTSVGGGNYKTNITSDANQDYKVDNLSYDANGNIQNLKRNGVTNSSGDNKMDNFKYHYDNTNKLQYVEDTGDNSNPNRYNDLKDQSNNGGVNYFYNSIGQLVADVESKMLYEYNTSGLVSRVNTFSESTGQNTNPFALYAQDFENVTNAELLHWTADTGQISINYSGSYNCSSIALQYNSSVKLSLDGNRIASRYFDIVPNVAHTLSLDVIAEQSRRVGYKITIFNEQNQVLVNTNYNLGLANITDPDHPSCGKYYDQNESLSFTSTTAKIRFEIQILTQASPSEPTEVYLDNLDINLNVEPKLAFYYNDRGQRVRKEVYLANALGTDNTYYVRDAGGSPLAIYNVPPGRQPVTNIPEEHPVYGASRLGVFYRDQEDPNKGAYAYQLTDHLGNVRAVVMKTGDETLSLTNQTDYYPFGMPMPDRNVEGDYRYKLQGQEKDSETDKEAFELRLWDSRIGRWASPDPLEQFHSPYLGMFNNPILSIDTNGGLAKIFDPPYNFINPRDVKGDRDIVYIYAANQSTIKDIPNTIRIHAHGNAEGFSAYVNGETRWIDSPEALDKLLTDVKSPDWKNYKENGGDLRIELLACNNASDRITRVDENNVEYTEPVDKSFVEKVSESDRFKDVNIVGASGFTVTSATVINLKIVKFSFNFKFGELLPLEDSKLKPTWRTYSNGEMIKSNPSSDGYLDPDHYKM